MNDTLKLGIATEIITPEIGGRLYGYVPDFFSIGLNDDLTVTALYFNQGGTEALMLSATVCLIQTELSNFVREEIERECGIPAKNILFHATHTHSGPNVAGTYGWGEIDQNYIDTILVPAILKAVKAAKVNPVAVRMAVTAGDSLVGVNRREINTKNNVVLGQNPWGSFNPAMTVITFANLEGKPVANIVHYGTHGTCAGQDPWISRDWPGVMTDTLADVSGAPTVFFNGPEGDVGPRLSNGKTTGKGYKAAMAHGAYAAQDAVRIYKQKKVFRDVNLDVSATVLNLPITPRMDLETAKEEYEKVKNETVNNMGLQAKYLKSTIESYENGYVDEKTRPIDQTVIKIGEVAFVGFPYELFSEIGMRIARASKIPYVLPLACTNGSEGYFVSEDQICRGGYEVKMFKIEKIQGYADNADWHLVTETLEHLKQFQ